MYVKRSYCRVVTWMKCNLKARISCRRRLDLIHVLWGKLEWSSCVWSWGTNTTSPSPFTNFCIFSEKNVVFELDLPKAFGTRICDSHIPIFNCSCKAILKRETNLLPANHRLRIWLRNACWIVSCRTVVQLLCSYSTLPLYALVTQVCISLAITSVMDITDSSTHREEVPIPQWP